MKRSVSCLLCVGLSAVCIWMLSARLTCAQERPKTGKTIRDVGPQLRLSLNKTEFRCGEVIPLDLVFTSNAPHRYKINLASYDRCGRMSHDGFLLDPKRGTSDPLQAYFSSFESFMGGGLFSEEFLSKSPTTIHLELNEWVRFDEPGVCGLTVVSQRVSDVGTSKDHRNSGIELKSNPVELRITTADAAWQQAQFRQIVEALNRLVPSSGNVQADTKQAALKALRYLGSAESARELARRLRGEDNNTDWDCMLGLIGSPHRDTGIEEMRKLLEDPDFPVSNRFLTTMSVLPLDPKAAPEALEKQRADHLKLIRQKLVFTLPNKRGKALAISLKTAEAGMDRKMPP